MEKIRINHKWMDRINIILTIIVVALITYGIGNTIQYDYPELGSPLALFCILIIIPVGIGIYQLMKLFLNDGRK